jgi:hypothetical protein
MSATLGNGSITFGDGTTQSTAASNGIGVGQTWQSFTYPARIWETTYTNTTGKPIMILILGHCQPNQQYRLTINGTNTNIGNSMGSGMSGDGYLTAIIPNGATYLAGNSGSGFDTGSGYQWWELR